MRVKTPSMMYDTPSHSVRDAYDVAPREPRLDAHAEAIFSGPTSDADHRATRRATVKSRRGSAAATALGAGSAAAPALRVQTLAYRPASVRAAGGSTASTRDRFAARFHPTARPRRRAIGMVNCRSILRAGATRAPSRPCFGTGQAAGGGLAS